MENKNNEINKPLSIIINDFKKGIETVVNNSNLPPVLIETIMEGYMMQIKLMAKEQSAKELQQYEYLLKKNEELVIED